MIPVDLDRIWKELEALVSQGNVRSIDVSNFTFKKLETLYRTARIKPAVNQVELRPYLTQNDLLEFCKSNNILLTAYSPLGRSKEPKILSDPAILKIAEKYNRTPAQVILNWAMQRGTAVIPRSCNPQRQRDNLVKLSLQREDHDAISGLNRDHRFVLNSHWGIQNLFSD